MTGFQPIFRTFAAFCLSAALVAGADARPADLPAAVADWRQTATAADRVRLRGWRKAWNAALARVRAAGDGPAVDEESALFDPDRALDNPLPPPGRYLCRVYKLGANGAAMRDFTVYPAVACGVSEEAGTTSLYRTAGMQRPAGQLYAETSARAVFLGTMVLGDESRPLRYGQDERRDIAGYVERIGAKRWRLVLPAPRFESLLDVVDVVPDR